MIRWTGEDASIEVGCPRVFHCMVCAPVERDPRGILGSCRWGASWEGVKSFFDALISPGGGSNDDSRNQEAELVGSSGGNITTLVGGLQAKRSRD